MLELAIGLARAGSSGPVVLLGDSLGGIMSWYLLTREPDIDAAICHCIGHPDVHPEPLICPQGADDAARSAESLPSCGSVCARSPTTPRSRSTR